jgi:protein subunit release factor A
MKQIVDHSKEDIKRERVTIAHPKDFDVSYFCGSGAGGQARNKVASGVQIIHRETGAIGRASDSRSQADNKKKAFERLLKSPRMKFWISAKIYELRQHETLEETIQKEVSKENLRFEIKENGVWKEVTENYFSNEGH